MISKSQFNEEIRNIVEQLIRLYKPEKIYLFGSLAAGKADRDSDIDFLIVKKNVPELGVDRIRQLDELIKYKIATDFIVYKPEEFETRLNLDDPFIKNILREGKLLYEAA